MNERGEPHSRSTLCQTRELSDAEATAAAAPYWLRWALPVAIAAVTFVAFLPSLNNDFLNWDDDKVLVNNPGFRGLGLQQLEWGFTNYFMGHYHPLTWISYGIDYRIWGIDNAFGYHLTNLLLHTLNAVLFYFLAARVLSLVRGMTGPPSLAARAAAAAAALLFAVHPLRVESVAWATERRDVLSVCFLLACVLCYVRYALGGAHQWRWYAAAIVLLLASLLSKAWGMTLPVLLLVLDVWPLGRVQLSVDSLSRPGTARVLLDKIPFAVLAFVAAILAAKAQAAAPDTMKTLAEHGLVQRIAQAFYGLAFYVWKTLVPIGLAPLYQIPQQMNPFEPRFVLSALLVGTGLVAVLKSRRCRPAGPVLLAFYVITLLPVLGFSQSGPQLVADRYTYVACLPLALLAGAGLWWGAEYLARRWGRVPAVCVAGLVSAAVIAGLALMTWQQAFVWRNSQTVWERVLAIWPGPHAHHNLGVHLANNGLLDQAITEFSQTLQLDPRHTGALVSLGRALYLQGRTGEAIEYYNAALSIKSNMDTAHRWLGEALRDVGRTEEATLHFREAARLNPAGPVQDSSPAAVLARLTATVQGRPDDPQARYELGLALAGAGRFAEAVDDLTQAVRLAPEHFDARSCLAAARAALGDVQAAIFEYEQALVLRPDSAEAHGRLADLLAGAGRTAEAVEHYRAALRWAPTRFGSANNLALLLTTSQDPAIRNPAEAVRLAEQACQGTNFSQPVFLNTLAAAYAEAGRFEEAVQTLQQVMSFAAADPNKAFLEDVQRRLRLYQQHRTSEP